MNWYFEALKKYAVFDGRARRMEYWMFVLFNVIINIILSIIDAALGTYNKEGWGLLQGIFALVVFLPGLAVGVRRLHDIGRSGWWLLLALMPCIGGIILLVFMIQDGEPGENQYGPNPKEQDYRITP